MSTYLINHLRIPVGIPNEEGLAYLEQVEDTVKAYGGQWLAQGDVQVVEGARPDSAVLIEFPLTPTPRTGTTRRSTRRSGLCASTTRSAT
jgi:uncharacterized protein (DUF1330 family)